MPQRMGITEDRVLLSAVIPVPGLDPGISPGDPRLCTAVAPETWMAGTSPAMTGVELTSQLWSLPKEREKAHTNCESPGIEPTMGPITSSPAFSRP
jgi:hypothetical protein